MTSPRMKFIFRSVPLLMALIVGGMGQSEPGVEKIPPMYLVHDAATEAMHQRMVIGNGQPCNTRFGSQLEEIMGEMEKNKEADEELAKKLDGQFKAIMIKDADKRLCAPESWCDLGTCKQRIELVEVKKSIPVGESPQPVRSFGRAIRNDDSGANTTNAAPATNTITTTTTSLQASSPHDHDHDNHNHGPANKTRPDDEDPVSSGTFLNSSMGLVTAVVTSIFLIHHQGIST